MTMFKNLKAEDILNTVLLAGVICSMLLGVNLLGLM